MTKKNIILIRNAQSYDFGGGERFPVFVAMVLKNKGFNPIIISRSNSLRNFSIRNDIKTVKGWWWSRQSWNGAKNLLLPIYIVWQIILIAYYSFQFIKLKPSVVHIQSKDDFIAATLAAKLYRARIIWTDHADLKHVWKNVGVWYKNPIGKLVLWSSYLASSILVVSKNEENIVLKNIKKGSKLSEKIQVMYNGAFDAFRNTTKQQQPLVIYTAASRMVTDKGIAELIKAFLRLNLIHKDTELWLLGEGKDRANFEKIAANHACIKFFGQQADPFVFFAKSNIFVHPTYHEGFSLSLVEASMFALPIIATNVGGNPEIIHDKITGLLVKPRDESALLAAMKELYESPSLQQVLGNNARKQFIQKFKFENIITNQLIPIYEGVSS